MPKEIISKDGGKVALVQVIWALYEHDVASYNHRLHILSIKDGIFCLTPATFIKGASSRKEISLEGDVEEDSQSFAYGD